MKDTAALKKRILLNLPYVLIFWFFNKIGEAYRLAPGKDFAAKFMELMTSLSAAMKNPIPSFNPMDLLVGLIGAAVIFLVVWHKKTNAKKWRKDIEYGSALCRAVREM
jgi:type IV secretion system protein VirD4